MLYIDCQFGFSESPISMDLETISIFIQEHIKNKRAQKMNKNYSASVFSIEIISRCHNKNPFINIANRLKFQ